MEGRPKPLITLFEGANTRLVIPLYQREYQWSEKNCAQLYADLISLRNSSRKQHFFGSIVATSTIDSYVVDGQQRLTTVALLLIALVNAAKDGLVCDKAGYMVDKILTNYLVDRYRPEERKMRLKPVNQDMAAYNALLTGMPERYIQASNITKNYLYYYNKVKDAGITLDEWEELISKLVVIDIRVDEGDDPQLIFESLNSTGKELEEADKVRNYLFMGLSPSEQDTAYMQYWEQIEKCTKGKKNSLTSNFLRDYLSMKFNSLCNEAKLYESFKEYAEKRFTEGRTRTDLLKDLLHYARIYDKVRTAAIRDNKTNLVLAQLATLESLVAYPFYLAFFHYAETHELSDVEVYQVISFIESYWARRIICNRPSNVLNKLFATLHREVCDRMDKVCNEQKLAYIDALIAVILDKQYAAVFPDDKEVQNGFATRQVYKIPRTQRNFIIERMENRDSNERHDVIAELDSKNISIEHIMPQKLTPEWKTALGNDWERIHAQYLHTMANLTLTGYNSKYSNRSFLEKRNAEHGFNDSAFRLNNSLKSCTEWTEKELVARQQELLNVFLQLWPMPTRKE